MGRGHGRGRGRGQGGRFGSSNFNRGRAAAGGVEGFEEPATVGKVTLHSLDFWVIDSGATYSMTPPNLISVRRLQKASMDTSSKGSKTYTARLGERKLWDLHEDRDIYNEMWQIPVVPMPKERQVAASVSTKREAVGGGDHGKQSGTKSDSKECNLGETSKACEPKENGAAAKGGGNEEEKAKINKAAAAKEKGESLWGTIASAAFSNPTSATGECDWLTLHRRMGHVALPILQQIVKQEMLGAAGAEYFLTIVDVYTRMTWVYVLPKKSDVAETVKTDWLPMVERQQDRLVKAIRTDLLAGTDRIYRKAMRAFKSLQQKRKEGGEGGLSPPIG
ncbi:hypothetical protein CLOP_g665 [Closterium sp. NIES-67]|nr:hypothetical protein CLOP_g665 [Closterium sp. NIES-67]